MARRLPVYLLIDTSGSMKGEPIESVKVGIDAMLSSLRSNPYALETVWLSIITYDREVKVLMPLTPIDELQMPQITTPDSGPTNLGQALEVLYSRMRTEVRKGSDTEKGDWKPNLFVMTDGKPSDIMLYNEMAAKAKDMAFSSVVACAAGPKAQTEPLRKLTDNVYQIDNLDSAAFSRFFQWVSDIVQEGGKSMGATGSVTLPKPPDEINIVI